MCDHFEGNAECVPGSRVSKAKQTLLNDMVNDSWSASAGEERSSCRLHKFLDDNSTVTVEVTVTLSSQSQTQHRVCSTSSTFYTAKLR